MPSLAGTIRERQPERIISVLHLYSKLTDRSNSCSLPTPKYLLPEQARLAENFYGPETENYSEDKLLTRRIQGKKDIAMLLGLYKASRRGKRVD
ncbi:hypothetical protein NUU61_008589 [Penicillium alfredii]|uniref:Uncharacterized protein n=1 Tax=Penicillium alfredii TaxID=1506179 RepID=A0A9W9ELP4_9EURO|nr:uncharacterized protein NUU61_008589 [Penicillium alfredii]KAJ5084010.1 hypothetical protein NUU61_008589 [Penicillium alfredii]